MSKNLQKTNLIAGCGMLTAAATVLQFLEISLPVMPSFIKLDFSDLPALIGAFAYGPLAGVLIELFKNLLHAPFGSSAFIGEISNFLLGAVFTATAGLIYKKKQSKSGALLGGLAGAAAMAVAALPSNYFLIYPLYYKVLGFPEAAVLGMYQALLPAVKNLAQALIIFNVPFTLVKGLLCVGIALVIYKPLSPLLRGKRAPEPPHSAD